MVNKIIKELENLKNPYVVNFNGNLEMIDYYIERAIEIVKKYENDGWHIVKDGDLPKIDDNYIVSVSRINPTSYVDYFDIKQGMFDTYADVIAWKQLPQLYKVE